MDFEKVIEVLKNEGYKKMMEFSDTELKEQMCNQDDDYVILRENQSVWEIHHVHNERRQFPEYELLGKYPSKEKATVMFLLNRLRKFYLFEYVSISRQKSGLSEKGNSLVIEDLFKALECLGIPKIYVSIEKSIPHSMRLVEDVEDWRTVYIDENGQELCKTIPESFSDCISTVLARAYYLFLLDSMSRKYLGVVKATSCFSVEEIVYYIKGK